MIFQVVQLKYGYYSYTEETVHLKKINSINTICSMSEQ